MYTASKLACDKTQKLTLSPYSELLLSNRFSGLWFVVLAEYGHYQLVLCVYYHWLAI